MLIHSHQARSQIPLHLPNWRSTAAKWSFGRNHHSTPKDIQSASSDRSGNSCERWYASCFRVRWIRTRPDSIYYANEVGASEDAKMFETRRGHPKFARKIDSNAYVISHVKVFIASQAYCAMPLFKMVVVHAI